MSAYRPATVPELAQAIRELLARDEESLALRVMLDGLNRLPLGEAGGAAQPFLTQPPSTGDLRWDTLPQWWWPAGEVVLRAQTLQRTPIDFKRVGIWFDERNFETA